MFLPLVPTPRRARTTSFTIVSMRSQKVGLRCRTVATTSEGCSAFFWEFLTSFFFFLRLPNAAARVEPFASNRALHQPPVHNPGHKPSQPTRTDLLYPYKPYPTPTQTLNTTASRLSRTTKARARRLRTSRSPIPSASSGTPLRTKPR